MYLETPLSKYQASLGSPTDRHVSCFEGSYTVYVEENGHSCWATCASSFLPIKVVTSRPTCFFLSLLAFLFWQPLMSRPGLDTNFTFSFSSHHGKSRHYFLWKETYSVFVLVGHWTWKRQQNFDHYYEGHLGLHEIEILVREWRLPRQSWSSLYLL